MGCAGYILFDKLFALLLTFALVLCGLCGLNFYLYIRSASKSLLSFRVSCASRILFCILFAVLNYLPLYVGLAGYNFVWFVFALILNLCPLFTWASRAILNSYACLFSSLKPPFTFTPPTVRLVVAPPCLPFCFIHLRIYRSITPAVPLGLVYFACCI